MSRFGKRKSARRGTRAGLLAGAVVVALGIGGASAGGAAAAPSCTGSNILGEGASLQKVAQQQVWVPGIATICAKPGLVTYEGPGSANGLNAWNFNGTTTTDTSRAFVASDDAPTSAQIANAETSAGGAKVLVIPVTQTAIGAVVNPPSECSLEEITNKQLESVLRGNIKTWGKIDTATGTGCAGAPITRVVRSGSGSGTTYQFKNYLNSINSAKLACTESPGKSWKELEPIGSGSVPGSANPNITWPENGVGGCTATQLSPIVRATSGTGGGDLVKKVNITDGSIGYAALPDIEGNKGAASPFNNPAGDTSWIKIQNNGLVKLANASMASPLEEANNSANCGSAQYAVPAAAQTTGESVDWSQVFGANTNISGATGNSEAYPLCTLTYDMAFKGYSKKAGFTEGQVTTVIDYLREYITATTGQTAIANGEKFYAPLPTGSGLSSNVLKASQLSAGKIAF